MIANKERISAPLSILILEDQPSDAELMVHTLRRAGFNVVTWDPRGFGHSGGEAEVDSPNDEGRDVSAMLNWVAQQLSVQLDRPGVPRVGMVGESYGGGVQFAAAERDCRIDAIAPTYLYRYRKGGQYADLVEAIPTGA